MTTGGNVRGVVWSSIRIIEIGAIYLDDDDDGDDDVAGMNLMMLIITRIDPPWENKISVAT